MMKAQLTEETQSFFEATLKSKAVSENCNVKFSCVVTGKLSYCTSWKHTQPLELDQRDEDDVAKHWNIWDYMFNM